MKNTFLHGCAAACLLAFASGSQAQTTTVYFNSGTTTGKDLLYSDKALTTLLTAGNVNTAGDGAVLRLGYYQNATTAVSDSLWTWASPQTPSSVVLMSFDDYSRSQLQWLGGTTSAFYTSQLVSTVPEPSTWLMGAGLLIGFLWKCGSRRSAR